MSYIATALCVGMFLGVCVFELSGVVVPSVVWKDEDIMVLPRVLSLKQTTGMAILVFAQALAIAAPALVVMRARDHMFAVQRRAFDAAARVRQLLPKETRSAAGDLGALADDGTPSTRAATRASSRSSSSRTPKA